MPGPFLPTTKQIHTPQEEEVKERDKEENEEEKEEEIFSMSPISGSAS